MMEAMEVVARLHELAEPIKHRADELAIRRDIPVADQRIGVQALMNDARFLDRHKGA